MRLRENQQKKAKKACFLLVAFCMMAAMQIISSSSKFLFITVLSCSLLIGLYGNDTSVTRFDTNTSVVVRQHPRTVLPAESIWASMGSELKLDHKVQFSRVQAEIRKLLADREKFHQILESAAPYIYYIRAQTRARGLPAEIALIPVIESEFNPNDHSKKGATGLWQIMPGTARELGLQVKSGYDGRRNVVDSTKAALAYFNDLGNNFKGDWYLAIAAYNCGEMKVITAKRRAGSTSYWNLPLPKETKLYVPKLLAVAEIVKHPEKYGVELPHITNEPYFAEVKVKKPVNLGDVSKSSGIDIDDLHALNPDYKHEVSRKNTTHALLVPVDKTPVVKAHLAGNVIT